MKKSVKNYSVQAAHSPYQRKEISLQKNSRTFRHIISRSIIAVLMLCAFAAPAPAVMDMSQTISDGAQRTTLAFSGLAMMTGNLYAQSFYPPGKVADYTGFQYLRDNDPSGMGHNTSFLTRVANNVIYTLNDSQLAQLATLATAQQEQFSLYGYKRFALMKAFRRLMEGDIPSGATGLDLDAVKLASRELYLIDGQISFDRALLYAKVLSSMDSTQKAYLDAMKGKGWSSWPDITSDQIKTKMSSLPKGSAVAVMTYAGDIFSWYAGTVDADVYFCPERQGTYYGGFYIKDAPAVGHEGYSIDEQLTATAGSALCDSSKGYVTDSQAAVMSSLVATQKNNLCAGTTNIVSVRTQIATLLRGLLISTAASDSIESQVLSLSGTYGDLDGENNYNYATIFAQVYSTLTADQKTKLAGLRKEIMSGTYSDGTAFDFSVCTTPFLYSEVIKDTSLLDPYISDTDYLFGIGTTPSSTTTTVPAGTTTTTTTTSGSADYESCINNTLDNPACKDCCDCLDDDAKARTACRDECAVHDFSQNTDFITVSAPSSLGPDGDYSACVEGGTAPACKDCCDGASELLCGDRRYCRDACNAAFGGDNASTDNCSLKADFAAEPSSSDTVPLTVTFADKSQGAVTSYLWDFGDGNKSTSRNPSHTYTTAEKFTVSLTVSGAACSDTETKEDFISTGDNGSSPNPCAVLYALEGRAHAGESAAMLRNFRDSVLKATVKGRLLTMAYYAYSNEVKSIFARDPALKEAAGSIVDSWMPYINEILLHKKVTVEQAKVLELAAVLGKISDRGDLGLKMTISLVLNQINHGALLKQYGVFLK